MIVPSFIPEATAQPLPRFVCWRTFALRFAVRETRLRWLFLDRTVVDSDRFQSHLRQLQGEGLGGLVVPAPDRRSSLGLDLLHQAGRDQFVRHLLRGAAFELWGRRQAKIIPLCR